MANALFATGPADPRLSLAIAGAVRRYVLGSMPQARVWVENTGARLGIETTDSPHAAQRQATAAALADLDLPLTVSGSAVVSAWLPSNRAQTVAYLVEAALLSGNSQAPAIDVSVAFERGDIVDHAGQLQATLTVTGLSGNALQQRVDVALTVARQGIRDLGSAASQSAAPAEQPRPGVRHTGKSAVLRFERVAPSVKPEDPWAMHRDSYKRFQSTDLPQLLSRTIGLADHEAGDLAQRLGPALFPAISNHASFMVNGRERICIARLEPAPGGYGCFDPVRQRFFVRVVPRHGASLRFELNAGSTPREGEVFSLGELGRRRLNAWLGLSGSADTLQSDDLAAIQRRLADLQRGRVLVDDVNHAANLVVRPVGDMLFEQLLPVLAQLGPDHASLLAERLQPAVDCFFRECTVSVDTTNALATLTQARQVKRRDLDVLEQRRVDIPARSTHPSHWGRLCSIETPEGDGVGLLRSLGLYARLDQDGFILAPYLKVSKGRVTAEVVYLAPDQEDSLTLAAGDAARDASGALLGGSIIARQGIDFRKVPVEQVSYVSAAPAATLGASCHCIPLIEYDDANRALMGANMSRQALAIPGAELPIVATGFEEQLAGALGRNLLVGFVHWEGYNHEDGIVISERLAAGGLLGNVEVGDKLANRHGAKGVVAAVLPVEDMPHLADGTPMDLLMSPLGVPSRMNIGQLMEAHLSLAAQCLGSTVVSPPLAGATPSDLEALFKRAGLPQDGRLQLIDGRTGKPFDQPSSVGFVYYYRLKHTAEAAIQARSTGQYDPLTQQPLAGKRFHGGQRLGRQEIWALLSHGATRNLAEMLTIKSDDKAGREAAYQAILAGNNPQVSTAPNATSLLITDLRAAGLGMEVSDHGARITFASAAAIREWSSGEVTSAESLSEERGVGHVELAAEVEHPWCSVTGASGPTLAVLPVLPSAMRRGGIGHLYARVLAENTRLKAQPGDAQHLQTAVDALFGVERYDGKAFLSRDRKADTLAVRLVGRRGRFVAGLEGKVVNYSGRAVVAPGPWLAVDECGLPVRMAMELFRPFVLAHLTRNGMTPDAAEQAVSTAGRDALVALQAVVKYKVVLLVRAPVLHKFGILAFRPVLTRENAIRLHSAVTVGFNADFDGDQMTVHVPLSAEAQAEARQLMMASANLASTAFDGLVNPPSQEMVLGCHYMTVQCNAARGEGTRFASAEEAVAAWQSGRLDAHATVSIAGAGLPATTTVGRVVFNRLLPPRLRFVNQAMDKATLCQLLIRCRMELGNQACADLLDAIKAFGFHHVTLSGMSLWRSDPTADRERIVAEAAADADSLSKRQATGGMSQREAYLAKVERWTAMAERMRVAVREHLAAAAERLLPVALMVRSQARGNEFQMLNLYGTGGPVTDMFGGVSEEPVLGCGMLGLDEMEYFRRSVGARIGIALTMVRSAPAGDLMRRVVEALEDMRITEADCGSKAATRSVLTCESSECVCAACYGTDLQTRLPVPVGASIGITAALSLGEPMTQLMFRSFTQPMAVPYASLAAGNTQQHVKFNSGFPRLEELFEMLEKRRPHGAALDGVDERPQAQSVLEAQGLAAAREYLVSELRRVYGESGVRIDRRHYEVAVRAMTSYADPATGRPLLLPMSEVAQRSGGFIAAAASWKTLEVLVRAALSGERSKLTGVRENVILGRPVPLVAAVPSGIS